METHKYNNKITTTLNISQPKLSCKDVVHILKNNGIVCNVSNNTTVQCNSKKCWLENGCNITIGGLDIKHLNKDVWTPLKQHFNLTCAHLDIHGIYKGCILNFLRKSECR